jgi:hypothetical protein
MNKYIIRLLLSCVIIFTSATAQWKNISNRFPSDTKVYSMSKNNNSIFAGTNDGVYKSTDGGLTWQGVNRRGFHSMIPKEVKHLELGCLAVKGKMIYAGTNGLGVFIFDGDKWYLSTDGLPVETSNGDRPLAKVITYDQQNVFLGAEDGRVYILSDGDSSWSESSIVSSGIDAMLVKGDSILVGCGCYSRSIRRDCCLFLSTNQGKNWINFDSTLGCHIVSSLSALNGIIYIGTSGEESSIFKSSDNGKSWICLVSNAKYPFINVQSIFVQGDKVFAGTIGGLLYSNDGGLHWAFIQHPAKKHKNFNLESIIVTEKEVIAITPFELWSYPISSLTQ